LPDTTISIAQKLEVIAENISSDELIKIFRSPPYSNPERPSTTPHVTIYPPSNHVHSETSPTLDHYDYDLLDDYNEEDVVIRKKKKT